MVTTGILFAFVFWDLVKENRPGTPGIRTTHSSNVDAAVVCYTLFERLGFSVKRSENNLFSNVLNEVGVMFLLDPIIPVHSGEIKDIQAWLISGGILICTEIPKGLSTNLDILRNEKTFPFHSYRISQKTKTLQSTSIPVENNSLPLARDLSRIYFETSEVFDVNIINSNHGKIAIDPLLFDSCGLRIVKHKLGKGHLIILSDSSFLANGKIGKGDNSVLAVNLVSYALSRAKDKRVVFDEYHFGYGYHEAGLKVLSKMLFTTAAGWTVLSLTFAGVLFMIYKGKQFGFRRDLEKNRRRSKLEYIHAVGSTYRSAGANLLTLEIIFKWLKNKATNLTNLAENASNGAIATELSRRSGGNRDRYKEVLNRCDKQLSKASLSERGLLLTIKQLAQIEKEVFNEYRNRE